MSDNWLKFIPSDPYALPTPVSAEKAFELLTYYAPEAHGEISAQFSDEVEFHDCGANWEGVECPNCGNSLEDWWGGAMDTAYASQFRNLRVSTPCCGHQTSLNDLRYISPAGFARFVLEAENPNIKDTTPEQERALSEMLGMELRKIWTHL